MSSSFSLSIIRRNDDLFKSNLSFSQPGFGVSLYVIGVPINMIIGHYLLLSSKDDDPTNISSGLNSILDSSGGL